jgi:hypothetical protein
MQMSTSNVPIAPLTSNGQTTHVPIANFLHALIRQAQAALQQLDALIPPQVQEALAENFGEDFAGEDLGEALLEEVRVNGGFEGSNFYFPPPTKEELLSKYEAYKIYDWHLYANDASEKNLITCFNEVVSMPLYADIKASYLFTYAMGEGLILWIKSNYITKGEKQIGININTEIDGFAYLGTDVFSSERDSRLSIYLPSDFKKGDHYIEVERINELAQKVKSAIFKDLKSGLIALAAMLLHRKSLFEKESEILKYGAPTEDEAVFWTYVFFQQGEGNAKKILKKNNNFSYKKSAFISKNWLPARTKAIDRLATWRYIEGQNIFIS